MTHPQVASRSWTPLAELVQSAGPVLSVAQLGIPVPASGGESATDAAASLNSDGGPPAEAGTADLLRLAFSGATSGDIAVWDLTGEGATHEGSAPLMRPVVRDDP